METQQLRAYFFAAAFFVATNLFAQTIPVSLSVNVSVPGNRVNEDFVGFSMEQKTLTTYAGGGTIVGSFWVSSPTALTQFRNLLTNISSHSIIRVGGNSADRLNWVAGARGSNSSTTNLYNSDIDKFFGFLSTVGWKSIYTVNFAKDSANYAGNAPAEDAAEANYVYSTYGSLLKSISIGNEPMAYVVNGYRNPYTPSQYVTNYLPVYDAIKSLNASIPISGGDIGRRTEYNTWNGMYLQKMNNLSATSPARPINSFNAHAYPFRGNELTGTTEQNIDALINSLSPGSTFQTNLSYLSNLASINNTPFRMSETNSITEGPGSTGVVNSFATAIWALDYLYALASYKAEGANFHTGGSSNLTYSPIYRANTANGAYGIGAIYYGLLAFMDGARNQRLLAVTPPNSTTSPRASYYATTSDDGKTLTVTLINKDFNNTINASVNIPGMAIGTASYQTLRPQNNMYDLAANTFYANAQVTADGTFTKGVPSTLSLTNTTSFSVTIAPMTAVIVTVMVQSPPTAGNGSNTLLNAGGNTGIIVPANTFTNGTPSSAATPGIITGLRLTSFPTNVTSLTIGSAIYTSASIEFSGATPVGVAMPTDGNGNPTVAVAIDPTSDASPVSIYFKAIDNASQESVNTGIATLDFSLTTPDLTAIVYARPSTVNGIVPTTVVVSVVETNNVATTGIITVKVPIYTRLPLTFNSNATSVGGRLVQNSAWTLTSTAGGVYTLTTNQSIAGKNILSFGLDGSLNPGPTTGSLSITATVVGGSGGEVKSSNNADADKIEYFQQ